jgi:hypothetical protein
MRCRLSRPTLKSSAEQVVKKIERVNTGDNELLPLDSFEYRAKSRALDLIDRLDEPHPALEV